MPGANGRELLCVVWGHLSATWLIVGGGPLTNLDELCAFRARSTGCFVGSPTVGAHRIGGLHQLAGIGGVRLATLDATVRHMAIFSPVSKQQAVRALGDVTMHWFVALPGYDDVKKCSDRLQVRQAR